MIGLAAALLAAVLPAAPEARPLEAVKASGTLRVTVYRDFKPYSWIENGVRRGIDVDIGAALAKSLGVRVEYMDLRADDDIHDDLRNGVWRGTVVGATPGDVMLHVPFDKSIEEHSDRVRLVAPYHVEGLALAVDASKAGRALDFSLFDVEKVAVDIATLADIILLSEREHRLVPNVVHVRGLDKAADAFERGEVSAYYGQQAAVESLARNALRPTAIVYPKSSLSRDWPLGIAVRSDSTDLGSEVARNIDGMKAAGELTAIFARYGAAWRNPSRAD